MCDEHNEEIGSEQIYQDLETVGRNYKAEHTTRAHCEWQHDDYETGRRLLRGEYGECRVDDAVSHRGFVTFEHTISGIYRENQEAHRVRYTVFKETAEQCQLIEVS